MPEKNNQDFKKILTEIIQKQIVILGPDIAIMKARNIPELAIGDDGTVTEIKGNAQGVLQRLIDEYVALSGLIVRKTMEPLLSKYPGVKISNNHYPPVNGN